MSNRAQRRSNQRLFRHRQHIVTFLIGATDEAALHREPLLSHAADYWRGGLFAQKHWCVSCEATFAITGEPQPGLFLFAVPPQTPGIASVSAICTTCHRDLSESDIEAVCVRVLHRLWPNGKFLDAR
jgi:hypothetical protein